MARKLTQPEGVERYALRIGLRGQTQVDWDGPTPDGGPPIRRLAARAHELGLVAVGRRHDFTIYVHPSLLNVPKLPVAVDRKAEKPSPEEGSTATGTLFELPDPVPASPYSEDVAA